MFDVCITLTGKWTVFRLINGTADWKLISGNIKKCFSRRRHNTRGYKHSLLNYGILVWWRICLQFSSDCSCCEQTVTSPFMVEKQCFRGDQVWINNLAGLLRELKARNWADALKKNVCIGGSVNAVADQTFSAFWAWSRLCCRVCIFFHLRTPWARTLRGKLHVSAENFSKNLTARFFIACSSLSKVNENWYRLGRVLTGAWPSVTVSTAQSNPRE